MRFSTRISHLGSESAVESCVVDDEFGSDPALNAPQSANPRGQGCEPASSGAQGPEDSLDLRSPRHRLLAQRGMRSPRIHRLTPRMTHRDAAFGMAATASESGEQMRTALFNRIVKMLAVISAIGQDHRIARDVTHHLQ